MVVQTEATLALRANPLKGLVAAHREAHQLKQAILKPKEAAALRPPNPAAVDLKVQVAAVAPPLGNLLLKHLDLPPAPPMVVHLHRARTLLPVEVKVLQVLNQVAVRVPTVMVALVLVLGATVVLAVTVAQAAAAILLAVVAPAAVVALVALAQVAVVLVAAPQAIQVLVQVLVLRVKDQAHLLPTSNLPHHLHLLQLLQEQILRTLLPAEVKVLQVLNQVAVRVATAMVPQVVMVPQTLAAAIAALTLAMVARVQTTVAQALVATVALGQAVTVVLVLVLAATVVLATVAKAAAAILLAVVAPAAVVALVALAQVAVVQVAALHKDSSFRAARRIKGQRVVVPLPLITVEDHKDHQVVNLVILAAAAAAKDRMVIPKLVAILATLVNPPVVHHLQDSNQVVRTTRDPRATKVDLLIKVRVRGAAKGIATRIATKAMDSLLIQVVVLQATKVKVTKVMVAVVVALPIMVIARTTKAIPNSTKEEIVNKEVAVVLLTMSVEMA